MRVVSYGPEELARAHLAAGAVISANKVTPRAQAQARIPVICIDIGLGVVYTLAPSID